MVRRLRELRWLGCHRPVNASCVRSTFSTHAQRVFLALRFLSCTRRQRPMALRPSFPFMFRYNYFWACEVQTQHWLYITLFVPATAVVPHTHLDQFGVALRWKEIVGYRNCIKTAADPQMCVFHHM